MSNWVGNTIEDIQLRLGDAAGKEYTAPKVLRAMNRVYRDLNHDYLLVEKTVVVPAGTFSDTVYSFVKPADWIMPFRLLDGEDRLVTGYEWIDKRKWNVITFGLTLTELNNNICFSGVSESSAFTIYYYSFGLVLVNSDSPGDGQVNAVEWNRGDDSLILYKTALELKIDYTQAAKDAVQVEKLEGLLGLRKVNRQQLGPCIIGGTDII